MGPRQALTLYARRSSGWIAPHQTRPPGGPVASVVRFGAAAGVAVALLLLKLARAAHVARLVHGGGRDPVGKGTFPRARCAETSSKRISTSASTSSTRNSVATGTRGAVAVLLRSA
jgi:hypothetical protein